MEFIPYSCQNIRSEDIAAVADVLKSEFLTQGPVIPSFEKEFAERHQCSHAVAVSNATAGLHLALLALDVGPGSRVWTSPNSFVASANAALYCGASVDFVDIDASTRNLSVSLLRRKLEDAKSASMLPSVVIPVDFGGLPADLREIRALADEYKFRILEDASHATGATYLGSPVGSRFADITVFSFHAVKIITSGEGGMIVTQDGAMADKLRLLRSHGITRETNRMRGVAHGPWYYEQQTLGFNYRLTDMQAALGLSQLKRLDQFKARRDELARRYDFLLSDLPVIRPTTLLDRESAWHLYPIEVDDTKTDTSRIEVFNFLRGRNIGANVHYIPIHLQPFYADLGFKPGDFPASERYYRRAISIPLFPALTESQQVRVVGAIQASFVSST